MTLVDPAKTAAVWFNALPGSAPADKAYNFLIGSSVAGILFSKEIFPYTVDIVYALPLTGAILLFYKYAGEFVSGIVDNVNKVHFFVDIKLHL
jgi:hypothetical protein